MVVFESPLVRVGRWRCPADNPVFFDSGPTSDALFAFPRESVWIEHDGRAPFVADANTVTYYNKGQVYTRRKLSVRGDQCEWFAVAPDVIAETLSAHEPAAIDRPESPFPFTHGPSNPESYLRQRMMFHHVSQKPPPIACSSKKRSCRPRRLTALAYAHNDARRSRGPAGATSIWSKGHAT